MDYAEVLAKYHRLLNEIHNAGVGVEHQVMWMTIILVAGMAALLLMGWAIRRQLKETNHWLHKMACECQEEEEVEP